MPGSRFRFSGPHGCMDGMRTALVTGAGIRVGRSIALALARSGFDLVLHANRSRSGLEEVAAEIRSLGRRATCHLADLSDPLAVDTFAAEVRESTPRLDLLVHNAALFEWVPFARISREAYRQMQAVNLEAPFFLTQGLLPSLEASPSPQIIHVTDIAADRPYPEHAHYSVSKAGLAMLTRALAVELGPKIRVNAVAPGTVAFPPDYDDVARKEILSRIPLGREGSPEDVAGAVLYLVGAPYVSGQVIALDGGRSCVL